ncbi:unnamed protein product [Prunus armeniaca]
MGDNSIVGAIAATSTNLCVSDFIPGTGSNTWIIDTCASDHMTYDAKFFDELSSNTRDPYITSTNNLASPITGEGIISLTHTLSLSRALLVPNIHCNLLSDLKTHETIGHSKRIGVSKTNNKFGYGIVAWDTRHLAILSVCFHLYSALVMSPVLSVRHCILMCGVRLALLRTGFVGIIHQTTTPFTPQHNGMFERKNRQLLEVARSLMLDMSVPHHLWRHAVLSVAYLINRTPNRVLDFKTPHDVFGDHVFPVSVSKLPPKVFGCVTYVHGERGSELESLGLENDVFEDTALRKETTCRTEPSDWLPISEDGTCGPCEETSDHPLELDQLPIFGDEAGALDVETTGHTEASDQSPVYENNDSDSCMDEFDAIPLSALPVPQSTRDSESSELHDVLSNPKWMDAMNVEMGALNKNKTWDLVHLPQGKKVVGFIWVFTLNHKADGSIDHYNARLIAKGYTQTYGVDYLETFAPAANLNTVHVLLSLAANRDWPLLQFDVKNVFLHGDLKEEIYMDLPPGIPVTSKKGVVGKLRKSLYGLKQSPRAWFGRFAAFIKKFEYVQSNSDHILFLKRHKGKLTALIIYVDDMIVTGDDQAEMQNLHKYLASEFEMKSLGDLKYFLGIEVARSKHGIFLSQRKYILDLLAETGMLDCKPIDTPSEQNHKLGLYPDQVPTDKERYQRLVGKLIYLSHTRHDIAYAVSIVSQFMHSPSEDHMGAVMRILRYLKVTPGKGLMFCKYGHTDVEGYMDADWAGSVTDRRSTSRYFTFVGGNLVTWRSKKQKVVSRSSAEAKYCGMAQGVCELLWLRRLLRDLGFGPRKPMDLYCDNKAAIAIAHNPVQHDRTKHVEVDRHFVKEKLDAEIISFSFISSEYQLEDVLTKVVSTMIFLNSLDKLGMCDIFAPT